MIPATKKQIYDYLRDKVSVRKIYKINRYTVKVSFSKACWETSVSAEKKDEEVFNFLFRTAESICNNTVLYKTISEIINYDKN